MADCPHHDRLQLDRGSHRVQETNDRRFRAASDFGRGYQHGEQLPVALPVHHLCWAWAWNHRGGDQPDLCSGLPQGKNQVANDPARRLARGHDAGDSGDHRCRLGQRWIELAGAFPLGGDSCGCLPADVHALQVPGGRARASGRSLCGDAAASGFLDRCPGRIHDGLRDRKPGFPAHRLVRETRSLV